MNFITKYAPYTLDNFHFSPQSADATDNFTHMLRTMIKMNYMMFLFISNTGSCKTTLLRAIVREYYGISKDDPLPDNNLLFINNLKEQGINYYRTEMKIFCQSHTNIPGKLKIVIIDDIDTINEQSQQVFRNCMDKYGHNVHFIATCTSIQKVIESIQSRLQIIKIPSITNTHMSRIMMRVAAEENMIITESAQKFLLSLSENSVRIMMNYLEKIKIVLGTNEENRTVNYELCNKLCTDISFDVLEEYTLCIKRGDLRGAIRILSNIYDYGFSVIDILDDYFLFVKMTAILTEEEKYKVIPILCKFITAFHNIHEDSIELYFFTNNLLRELRAAAVGAAP
jgi:DNA polymerase III delta prime subunit